MLIHHNADISQRLREQSGGMREPWQHGPGGLEGGRTKVSESEGLYRGGGGGL